MKPGNPLFSLLIIAGMLIPMTTLQINDSGIRGRVYDKTSGEGVPFANVLCYQGDTLLTGVSSDIDGNYKMMLPPGKYSLKASFVGLVGDTFEFTTYADAWVDYDIPLSPSSYDLSEVSVACSMPRISCEMACTSTYITVDGLKSSPSRKSKEPELIERNFNGAEAGTLTAGRLNDFAKWDLWTGISDQELKAWKKQWDFSFQSRYTIQLSNPQGFPVIDAEVKLLDDNGNVICRTRTDNTGKAECFPGIYDGRKLKKARFEIIAGDKTYQKEKALKFKKGINSVEIPVSCKAVETADICFVVDATGSMSDEIEYLKKEILDIIEKTHLAFPDIRLRLSSVFYRDEGDEYIVRSFDFSDDINEFFEFIQDQRAGGGGDYPEALHTALDTAVNALKWSSENASRMLFLICDAPPHEDTDGVVSSLQTSIETASLKGIRFIPISGSGTDKSTEYLLRSFAIATNGTYVFLTDHSGVGGDHLKPTTDTYDVMLLNELLQKLLYEFLYSPPCDNNDITTMIRDTLLILEPKIIAKEEGQLNKRRRKAANTSIPETGSDSLQTIEDNTSIADSNGSEAEITFEAGLRYYPNPTTGPLNIEILNNVHTLYLADISGKLLEKIETHQKKFVLDMSSYPAGIYLLEYLHKGKFLSGKIVLMK